ncbi:uncharacterized protein LOC131233940 [Magnolia sinica]|uniref:uncharacterized protein LOC131233940 n=1 Tax=Magnolia sinica TaxID=86752 RepID=UPI00265B16F3|nr:uncharacterized protein LOC131233940 [Magnolia sinica]
MGKKGKTDGKIDCEGEEGEPLESVIVLSSGDDEEANEDLTLEIVERARERESKRQKGEDLGETEKKSFRSDAVIVLSSSSSDEIEFIEDGDSGDAEALLEEVKKKKKKKRSKKNKKKKKIEVDFEKLDEPSETVTSVETEVWMLDNVMKAEDHSATGEAAHMGAIGTSDSVTRADEHLETVETTDKEANGISDNAVLRKLLRGPRYFDPPDSHWGTCYNCGKEGHTVVNCTVEKRKKPCFVCGKFGHGAKHCTQGQDCFICKRRGHVAKDCPEKHQGSSQNYKICLRCGDPGHDMSSCRNDYAPDDLKAIQCYICKNFGHLCCVDIVDTGPREVSCFNCGQSGHTGLGCAKPRGEKSAAVSPTLCYKCGEEGHFARGCTKSSKSAQWMGEPSTPAQRFSKEGRDILEFRSVPHDHGKAYKKKMMLCEGRKNMTTGKSRWRGGWATDDPRDSPGRQTKLNGRISLAAGDHSSSSRSPFRRKHNIPPGTPGSHGSTKRSQNGFSASRFGVENRF